MSNPVNDNEWVEAGSTASQAQGFLSTINLDDLRLTTNETYLAIVKECADMHEQLIKFERQGKIGDYANNPTLVGEYQTRLRLHANKLFTFKNVYIDILSDLQVEYAVKRQNIYETKLAEPKGSPSGAEKHANEMTRIDKATLTVIQNNIDQVSNEYERYNGICMSLQSKMKENNAERIMG